MYQLRINNPNIVAPAIYIHPHTRTEGFMIHTHVQLDRSNVIMAVFFFFYKRLATEINILSPRMVKTERYQTGRES